LLMASATNTVFTDRRCNATLLASACRGGMK
jgi:hypothetical protein